MPIKVEELLKNKKFVLLAGIGVVVLIVLVSIVIIFSKGCKKKGPVTPEVKTQASETAAPGAAASSPADTQAQQPQASAPAAQPEQTTVTQPVTDTALSPAPAKKPFKWTKKRRIKDIPTLITMLKKALDTSDEKALNLALKNLMLQGEDVVGLLKEEIINNFSRPDIRRNAVWGLFYTDNPDAIPIVKTTLKVDPDDSVRYVALFVLYSMLKDDAKFFEDIAKTDTSEKIRRKAQEYFQIKNINQ